MNEVHYLGQYSGGNNYRNLRVFPSAITKMDYIVSALKRADVKVRIFSLAETSNRYFCHFPRTNIEIDRLESICFIDTIGGPTIIMRLFSRIWMLAQLLHFLLFRVKESDRLLIYHSLVYLWPVKLARRLRSLNIYFEVEELYHAAWQSAEFRLKREIMYLRKAVGYILVNDLIAEKCGLVDKPTVVCYGDYRYNLVKKEEFLDGYIHLAYAGLIDVDGGDVFLAVETMNYLPGGYRLHIMGYGTPEHINLLQIMIDAVNSAFQDTIILYHGYLSGEKYYSLLSKCDFGLCTRVLPDKLSDYTFPSKVLVYLGCKLTPVCSPISSVMKSKIGKFVVFTESVDAKSIAESIMSSKERKFLESDNLLNQMDQDFVDSIPSFFNFR